MTLIGLAIVTKSNYFLFSQSGNCVSRDKRFPSTRHRKAVEMYSRFIFAVLFLSLTACAPACDVDAYTEQIEPIHARWMDAIAVADSTPRMSLAVQINELQEIKRELDKVEVDECLSKAHDNLTLSYQYTIDGFLEFLAQAEDYVVSGKFSAANRYFQNYTDELASLQE